MGLKGTTIILYKTFYFRQLRNMLNMVAESCVNEPGELPTVEPVDTGAGPSHRHELAYVDDVMYDDLPRESVLERRLGIALERLDDAETGLQDVGASIRGLRDEYKTKIDEIKAMLSQIQDTMVCRPGSSALVASAVSSVRPTKPKWWWAGTFRKGNLSYD
jgi:hypothetical protein